MEAFITEYQEEGAVLTFFDPLYFKNKSRYKVGREYEFSLAGLGYQINSAEGKTIELPEREDSKFLRKQLAGSEEKAENFESIKLNLEGMAAIFPTGESEDEYGFSGPVKEVGAFEFRNTEFYRFKITIARTMDSEQDLDINVYFRKSLFENRVLPQRGENIEGAIWLQGYLAD